MTSVINVRLSWNKGKCSWDIFTWTCQSCRIFSNIRLFLSSNVLFTVKLGGEQQERQSGNKMENWIHADWTSSWVGGLPFILISLSCPLNVSQRARLIGFSLCTPTLFKGLAHCHSYSYTSVVVLKKKDNLHCAVDQKNGIFSSKHEKLFFSF